MWLRVTLRNATRTALICDPMIRSTSSKAMACSARRTTPSSGPPASYIDISISRPRIPPRWLISETASKALLVEDRPQIPGDPENVRKLPTRSLLRAPRRLEKPVRTGDNERSAAVDDRFLNNKYGGMAGPP